MVFRRPVGGHIQKTSLSSVVSIERPADATLLVVQAFGKTVRYTLDGLTNPTSSKGFSISPDDGPQVLDVTYVSAIKFIEAAASATLELQWAKDEQI